MAYRYGDVVWADLDPSSGHEQTKRRPLVVVSNNKFNARCNLTMVVPITSSDTPYPLHIGVGTVPGESDGAPIRGYAEAEQLKALDLDSRNAVKVGTIDEAGMDKLLGLVLSCLIAPDMMIVSGY
ncbi:MAG: type II toxin-antitoxin system PemK/MazF family toxin [Eggerthellaceae bacterium]|nr:type II toxin-antitoxin system PemK/MazF family toxin [Eggerthellaceae bacterium]